MGYNLELIGTFDSGELYKIIGLIDFPLRVSQSMGATNLENTLVFFTQHFQYSPVKKKPNANLINEFLNLQMSMNE